MAGANIKITIDEDSFKEAKEKLEELSTIAHAIRAETEKALEIAEVLKTKLEKYKQFRKS